MNIHPLKINQNLKYTLVLAGLVLLNAPGQAEEKNSPATPDNTILSTVVGDWNNDKRVDSATLLKSGDQADLYIYLNNSAGHLELKLTKKNLVWSGQLAGTVPHLNTDKTGGLLVYSENDAVGRDRWHQRINVNYRDNDFFVTGYGYDSNDTLDPKAAFSCDVNLVTGNAFKGNTPFKMTGQKIKLADWSEKNIPKECQGQ